MKFLNLSLLVLLIATGAVAQDFSALEYRNLGPYRGGRVTAVAGIASQPATFYLGASGGGVWKTDDYGTSWNNVSDGFFSTPSIGAIAVAQNDPNVVYVGTGSDGIRSNIIEGKGMFKSIDGGKNWEAIGLEKAGQIGAVKIHPLNHNIAYVAAIGNPFKANPERGIYKTINSGKTWEKVLYISDKVGFSDIEFLPSNPETLFAAAWKAERKPWTIISGGTPQEGGVYKSIDGGKSWEKASSGLPTSLIGKIDLALTPADSRIVYALVEAPGKEGGLFKSVDQGSSYKLVSNDKIIRVRPFYYSNIKVDPKNADIIYSMATRYTKSIDGGKTWNSIRPPHGDNHDMWINPNNPDLFIQANDGGANVTHNGGKTWSTQYNQPTAEIYQVEVDDRYPYWVYGGQQDNSTVSVPSQAPHGLITPGVGYMMNAGGCETGPAVPKPGNSNIVYSNCKGRFGVFNRETGMEMQFYVGASNIYGHDPKDLKYRFQRVSPIHVSPHNPDVVYHCSQFVHKTTDDGRTWEIISPDLTAFEADKQVVSGSPITRDVTGEEYYSTIYAIRESSIKEGLIWVGANDGPVHVTQNGGESWENVTPSKMPSGGRVDSVEPSPHNPAKAYASILRNQLGDAKPYIYKTTNYGKSWQLITNGIPADFPVRVIREDPEKEGLLFAGTEYGVFVSFDDGANWKPFQQNLPITPVTDLKIYRDDIVLSTMGRGFWKLGKIGALRQSNFSNINSATLFKPANTIRYRYPSGAGGSRFPTYSRPSVMIDYYLPKGGSGLRMEIKDGGGNVVATFLNDTTKFEEQVLTDMSTNNIEYLVNTSLTSKKGLNRFSWDMTMTGAWHKQKNRRYRSGPMVKTGTYTIDLTVDGTTLSQSLEIKMDPRNESGIVSADDIGKQVDLQLKVRDLLSEVRKLEDDLSKKEKEANDTDKGKITEALEKLKTQEGIYMQPMISDQVSYLYSMLNRADQVPGKDAYDRFEELKGMLDEVNSSLK